MTNPLDTSTIRQLRRLTQLLGRTYAEKLSGHLATLAPLFDPRLVLGRHCGNVGKQAVGGEDAAFEDLQKRYAELVNKKPFQRLPKLSSPIDVAYSRTQLYITPCQYNHVAETEQTKKSIRVKSPLTWILSYGAYGPGQFQDAVLDGNVVDTSTLAQCVVDSLVLELVLARRPAIGELLTDTRFSLSTERLEACGDLPVTTVRLPIKTLRPGDELLIETTEISGTAEFEEVVDVGQLSTLSDPLMDCVRQLAGEVGCELPT